MEMTHDTIAAKRRSHRRDGVHRIRVTLFAALLASVSFASGAGSRIELVDGTSIHGEVVSMVNGRYVIRSQSLGRIELPQSSIRAIQPIGSTAIASPASSSDSANHNIQAIQERIVASPELMQSVTTLMSDPAIQEAIKDPTFVQLIMSGDIEALKDDPRMIRLMNNPSMKAIVGEMRQ